MRAAVWVDVWFAAAFVSGSVGAQTTPLVRGRVVDSATGRQVNSAQISIRARTVLSDSSGVFVLSGIDTGSQDLRAKRLGYADLQRQIAVSAEGSADIRIAMIPVVTELQAIRVAGRFVPARFAEAYQRAASGRGVFFVREQL